MTTKTYMLDFAVGCGPLDVASLLTHDYVMPDTNVYSSWTAPLFGHKPSLPDDVAAAFSTFNDKSKMLKGLVVIEKCNENWLSAVDDLEELMYDKVLALKRGVPASVIASPEAVDLFHASRQEILQRATQPKYGLALLADKGTIENEIMLSQFFIWHWLLLNRDRLFRLVAYLSQGGSIESLRDIQSGAGTALASWIELLKNKPVGSWNPPASTGLEREHLFAAMKTELVGKIKKYDKLRLLKNLAMDLLYIDAWTYHSWQTGKKSHIDAVFVTADKLNAVLADYHSYRMRSKSFAASFPYACAMR